ncbi:hypothetical protein DsansV1_C23g0176381 [Dioscorea sansibarensis]
MVPNAFHEHRDYNEQSSLVQFISLATQHCLSTSYEFHNPSLDR